MSENFAAMGLAQSVWDTRRPIEPSKALTAKEKDRAYAREYYHRNKLLADATRVNPENHICAPTDDAKQARLLGKRNESRSQ